jgi:hypothetical protein
VRRAPHGSLQPQLRPSKTEDEHVAREVWTCRLPSSGEVVALVRAEAEARRLCPDMLVFTLAEVAVAIEALGEAAIEAKRVFPGATVMAVRDRGQGSKAPSVTENRGHKETPTIPKRKLEPLLPSGSYQSLSRKMPKDTRYKG